MAPLISLLVVAQALGAVVGAITAVWGELAYVRAHRDGKIDPTERRHLEVIQRGLRFGMSLILLASLGLVIVAYVEERSVPPAFTLSYWMLAILALLILGVSRAMSLRALSFARGSIVLFTAWWFLVYLTVGQLPEASVGATVLFFVMALAVFGVVLVATRRLAIGKKR